MTEILISIRLIRSFEYRNITYLILKVFDSIKTENLLEIIHQSLSSITYIYIYTCIEKINSLTFLIVINLEIQTESKYIPHRKKKYDTLKLYSKAHSYKSQNLVINMDPDDDFKILKANTSISDQCIENETEISCFVLAEYLEFKKNPKILW